MLSPDSGSWDKAINAEQVLFVREDAVGELVDGADCVIVEVANKPAGLLAKHGDAIQFFASDEAAFSLNRQTFLSIRDAINAIAEAIRRHKGSSEKTGKAGYYQKRLTTV